ncbi:MAG TPA: AAA domain-containing protein, partial [Kineosporiaceae bacterium]
RRATEAAERSQRRREQLLEHLDGASRSLRAFAEIHGNDDPAELYRRSVAHLDACDRALEQARSTAQQARARREELERDLSERISLLRQWKLTTARAAKAEEALRAVSAAADVAMTVTSGQTAQALRARCDDLNATIAGLEAEIEELEQALSQVEDQVIADALVIGTTLTRSYLRDSLWARRFDTVVLDEASMAPIPALWAVASRADRAAVAVGDWKQLPPIALSNHELAERWLGRDIFEAAGAKDPATLPHRIDLLRQYRMHPQISAIVNRLVYGGRLIDDPATTQQTPDPEWFNHGWWRGDAPVQVIDTGPADAWVTSVVRGSHPSRLNFLSAAVCLDLARAMLRPERLPLPPGDPPRMLLISPYRPHARLTELLIRDDHLVGEAVAGTAHAFQGSEADVVILDLVNDEPHWKVGMFNPKRDETTRRLLTVALTRARCRLIVVGDIDYIRKQSARAFLGSQFIPALLENAERVNALDIVPAHLSARVAAARSTGVGGLVEANHERLIVTQDRFFPLLVSDLNTARQRVVIYSPFITTNRLTELHPPLTATIDRGVPVFVVTKPLQDRSARDRSTYQDLQRHLEDWGVTVVPKRNMHEKLVFIDHDILWTGSLNPLSYSNTQEVMERRRSRAVADDYAKTLRLDDLLAGHQEKESSCPICGQPIVAAEGPGDPFYWRCLTDHCHTRNIGQPPLTDGVITCRTCNAPLVFGSWGDKDVWRCTQNTRHRQQIARSHLKLPKMRALIPAQELKRLQS